MSKRCFGDNAELDIRGTVAASPWGRHTRAMKAVASLIDTTQRRIHRYTERDRCGEVRQELSDEGEGRLRVRPQRS